MHSTWNFTRSPSKRCDVHLLFFYAAAAVVFVVASAAVVIRFYDLCKLPHISNYVKTCSHFLSFLGFWFVYFGQQCSVCWVFSMLVFCIAWHGIVGLCRAELHGAMKTESVFVCHSALWLLFFEYSFRTLFILCVVSVKRVSVCVFVCGNNKFYVLEILIQYVKNPSDAR